MMKESKLRFDELDIVKGIAILGVLWNHSFILFPINIHDLPWCQHASNINSTFYLISFFIVSGYLFSGRKQTFVQNLAAKSKRLLIPYFCFSVLNLLAKTVAPSLVNKDIESVWVYIEKTILYGGDLWFLYTLFLIMMVYSLILPRLKNKNFILIIIALLSVLDCIIIQTPQKELLLYVHFIHYSIFFLLGYYFRKIEGWRTWLQGKMVFFVLLIAYFFFDCLFINDYFGCMPARLLCKMLGGAFLWSLSFVLLKKTPDFCKSIMWCGKNSLGMYWLNGYCLVVARMLVVSVFHIHWPVLIAICVFLLMLMFEIIAINVAKKIPYLKYVIGC